MEVSELVTRVVPSPNCNDRKLPITMLVIHYTEMKPVETALDRLTDPEAGVSAHYLISEDGEVMQLVSETKRAWHAGASYWRGIKDVNSASIGIELDHPGHELGYRGFAEAQFEALVPLVARIVEDYDIAGVNFADRCHIRVPHHIGPSDIV
ncbi:MAG: N-acetylmuramoyl-L-alanine amidase, partial [Pseudomonadota bacterium]